MGGYFRDRPFYLDATLKTERTVAGYRGDRQSGTLLCTPANNADEQSRPSYA